jgi:hypothetical protein
MPEDWARIGHHLPIGGWRTLLFLGVLVMATALPPVQVDLGPQLGLLVEGAPPVFEAARDNAEKARTEKTEDVSSSTAVAERFKAGLAKAKEEFSQAIAAAIKLDRAREMASHEANMLRGEAERARQELSLALAEIRHLKAANAKLEQQVASLQVEVKSATGPARQPQQIPGFPDVPGANGVSPARNAQVLSDPVEHEAPPAVSLSSATTRATAPERAAKAGSGQPAAKAPKLARGNSDKPPSEVGSGLADLHVSIKALNNLEGGGTGNDLFYDIESVSGRAVHINATHAWHALPSIAKETYLDTLLESWVAARGGDGPGVVRIVDPSGRVLIQKSSP